MSSLIACTSCWREFPALKAHNPHSMPGNSLSKGRCHGTVVASIGLPWTDLLTQNQTRRLHHQAEAKAKRLLADPARWAIRAARLTPIDFPAHVTLCWRPPDRRRRDADGLAPSLKVALDALVVEGVLADDSATHVPQTSCRIELPEHRPQMHAVWVEITPHTPPEGVRP